KRHSTWRFFFQAEDGIRDFHVTGVQTCALPISVRPDDLEPDGAITVWPEGHTDAADAPTLLIRFRDDQDFQPRPGREGWTVGNRSEERRVGNERWYRRGRRCRRER